MVSEKWIFVTPEMATEWLEARHRNRTIHDRAVREYLMEMQEGRWKPEMATTQPIVLDSKGRLVNGQHRLSALVSFGRPLWLRVATLDKGADIESLRIAEATVRPQKTADLIAALDGKTHATTRAAFAKMWLALERSVRVGERVPTTVLLRSVRQHAALFDEVVETCRRTQTKHLCNATFGGMWLWVSTGKQGLPAEFRTFASAYLSGAGLDVGNPCLVLREHTLGTTFRVNDRAGLAKRISNAFESHLDGKTMGRVGLHASGFEALAKRIGKTACPWVINGTAG